MAARSRKSKRGSAASSTSQRQPDDPTFFLDTCLGKNAVAAALRGAGVAVEIHSDHFDPDTPDAEWLPEAGRRGWVTLTKDRSLLTNQLEIAALLKSGVPAFVLRCADMRGAEAGAAFVAALPEIKTFLGRFDPPFVAQISRSGNVSIVETFAGILKKVR